MKDCFACVRCGNYRWLHNIPPEDKEAEQKRERGIVGAINGSPYVIKNCPGFSLSEEGEALRKVYFPERFKKPALMVSPKVSLHLVEVPKVLPRRPVFLAEMPKTAVLH